MDKKYILKEIARTAMENGGKALGKDRFENATGIKFSDWYGKYWARWSDAVIEAGLEPNEMQAGYDEEWLIKQLICLIRDIKKFPTAGELRMKAHNDKEFPSHNTVMRPSFKF